MAKSKINPPDPSDRSDPSDPSARAAPDLAQLAADQAADDRRRQTILDLTRDADCPPSLTAYLLIRSHHEQTAQEAAAAWRRDRYWRAPTGESWGEPPGHAV